MSAPRDRSHEPTVELIKASTGFEAETIAATLGLPLAVRHTGYGQLEARLVAWMDSNPQ